MEGPKEQLIGVASQRQTSRWAYYSDAGGNNLSNIQKALEAVVVHKLTMRYQYQEL